MRVLCRHGHFAFYPQSADDLWRFVRIFKIALVQDHDFYTFETLVGLPRWSIVAMPYGLLPATVTYEGRHAFEVMRENSFVYSLALKTLVPAAAITTLSSIPATLNYFVASGLLLQPGFLTTDGEKVLGYEGVIDLDMQRLYVSSVETL